MPVIEHDHVGLLADRPAPTADRKDLLYWATDGGDQTNGALYQCTGAGWREIFDINVVAEAQAGISDAYCDESTWDGVATLAPSQNAIRDQIEAMLDTLVPVTNHSLYMHAQEFLGTTGSPAMSLLGARVHAWAMDAATTEQVSKPFRLPRWWTTANGIASVDVYLDWGNEGAGTGDVVWEIVYSERVEGDDLSAGDVTVTKVTDTAGAQNILETVRIAQGLVLDVSKLHYVRVHRLATDVADTLANDAGFIGLEFRAVPS